MVKENLLQVNVPKYQSMSLGSRLINFAMKTIEIYQIIRSIHLDSELNFSEHISWVCKKATQGIGVSVRLLKKLIPTYAKLQLHKAAILPHLTYCSTTIWHFCRASDQRKLERVKEGALSSQQWVSLLRPRGGGGGRALKGSMGRAVPPRPSRSRPYLRQETLLSNPNLFVALFCIQN